MIAVMVVLLITGLLASQTIQLLSTAARACRQRERIRQARELVELGRELAEQGVVPESRRFKIDVQGVPAEIAYEPLVVGDRAVQSSEFRIQVVYGEVGKNQEVASGESRK